MPITKIRPAPAPDQHQVVRVAELVAKGLAPTDAHAPLASLLVLLDQHHRALPTPVVAAVDAVVHACRLAVMGLRTVRVQDTQDHLVPQVVTVTVPWICPACGDPRGETEQVTIRMAGQQVQIDRWINECGHIDRHRDVVREAARYAEMFDGHIDTLGGAR